MDTHFAEMNDGLYARATIARRLSASRSSFGTDTTIEYAVRIHSTVIFSRLSRFYAEHGNLVAVSNDPISRCLCDVYTTLLTHFATLPDGSDSTYTIDVKNVFYVFLF